MGEGKSENKLDFTTKTASIFYTSLGQMFKIGPKIHALSFDGNGVSQRLFSFSAMRTLFALLQLDNSSIADTFIYPYIYIYVAIRQP